MAKTKWTKTIITRYEASWDQYTLLVRLDPEAADPWFWVAGTESFPEPWLTSGREATAHQAKQAAFGAAQEHRSASKKDQGSSKDRPSVGDEPQELPSPEVNPDES